MCTSAEEVGRFLWAAQQLLVAEQHVRCTSLVLSLGIDFSHLPVRGCKFASRTSYVPPVNNARTASETRPSAFYDTHFIFFPEDGGDTFLRNFGEQQGVTAEKPVWTLVVMETKNERKSIICSLQERLCLAYRVTLLFAAVSQLKCVWTRAAVSFTSLTFVCCISHSERRETRRSFIANAFQICYRIRFLSVINPSL